MTQQQQQEPVPPVEESEPSAAPAVPKFKVSRGLYLVAGAAVALSLFVTLFVRNPYTQAVQGDYYDTHPYDETQVWVLVLVVIPMIGLAAFIAWTRRRQPR